MSQCGGWHKGVPIEANCQAPSSLPKYEPLKRASRIGNISNEIHDGQVPQCQGKSRNICHLEGLRAGGCIGSTHAKKSIRSIIRHRHRQDIPYHICGNEIEVGVVMACVDLVSRHYLGML